MTKFFYRIENAILLNTFPMNYLNFNPIFVKTDNGLILTHEENEVGYFFERNDAFTYNMNNSNIYTAYYFILNNRQNYYERSYKRIQDIISDIGGVNQAITIIMIFINKYYNNYIQIIDF